jgi:hypothetical protein
MGQMGTAKSPMQQPKIPQIVGFDLLIYIPYTGILIYRLPSPLILTVGGFK